MVWILRSTPSVLRVLPPTAALRLLLAILLWLLSLLRPAPVTLVLSPILGFLPVPTLRVLSTVFTTIPTLRVPAIRVPTVRILPPRVLLYPLADEDFGFSEKSLGGD